MVSGRPPSDTVLAVLAGAGEDREEERSTRQAGQRRLEARQRGQPDGRTPVEERPARALAHARLAAVPEGAEAVGFRCARPTAHHTRNTRIGLLTGAGVAGESMASQPPHPASPPKRKRQPAKQAAAKAAARTAAAKPAAAKPAAKPRSRAKVSPRATHIVSAQPTHRLLLPRRRRRRPPGSRGGRRAGTRAFCSATVCRDESANVGCGGCRSRKSVESEETAAEAEKLDRENEAAGWANTVRTSNAHASCPRLSQLSRLLGWGREERRAGRAAGRGPPTTKTAGTTSSTSGSEPCMRATQRARPVLRAAVNLHAFCLLLVLLAFRHKLVEGG